MADQTPCAICGNQAEYELVPPRVTWRCSRRGAFSYDSSEGPPRIRSPDEMVRLSGWVGEQNAAGVVPVHITPEITRRVAQMPMPGLRERASRVLVKLARDRSDALFSRAAVAHDLELQGRSYSLNEEAVDLLIRILLDDNSLRFDGGSCAVTPKGLLAAEALQTGASNSAQGFVAMWFDEACETLGQTVSIREFARLGSVRSASTIRITSAVSAMRYWPSSGVRASFWLITRAR
jgi:hypothetical protein